MPAAVLLIVSIIPITVVSALLSGIALVLALREAPRRGRVLSIIASAVVFAAAVLLTLAAIPAGSELVDQQVTPK